MVTWQYFCSLAGIDHFKPDVMLMRFAAEALGRYVSPAETDVLLSGAFEELRPSYPGLTKRAGPHYLAVRTGPVGSRQWPAIANRLPAGQMPSRSGRVCRGSRAGRIEQAASVVSAHTAEQILALSQFRRQTGPRP
jgi:hypothetical protein